MEQNRAVDVMAEAMCDAVRHLMSRLPFDRTYQARVRENMGDGNFLIELGGAAYSAFNACGLSLQAGDRVYATAPQNDFSSLFIAGRRE